MTVASDQRVLCAGRGRCVDLAFKRQTIGLIRMQCPRSAGAGHHTTSDRARFFQARVVLVIQPRGASVVAGAPQDATAGVGQVEAGVRQACVSAGTGRDDVAVAIVREAGDRGTVDTGECVRPGVVGPRVVGEGAHIALVEQAAERVVFECDAPGQADDRGRADVVLRQAIQRIMYEVLATAPEPSPIASEREARLLKLSQL